VAVQLANGAPPRGFTWRVLEQGATAWRGARPWAEGGGVPEEEQHLRDHADSVSIDMVPDGFRFVSRGEVPLLGFGPLDLFTEPEIPQLLTRCAAWGGGLGRMAAPGRGAQPVMYLLHNEWLRKP
jgi:hypothetical protein